jgi:hypothetical protein
MPTDQEHLAHREWLGYVQPVGLVVSIPALLSAQAQVNRNIAADYQRFLAYLPRDRHDNVMAEIPDFRLFTQQVLGWEAVDLIPLPDVSTLPEDLAELEVVLKEDRRRPAPERGCWPTPQRRLAHRAISLGDRVS